MRPGERGWSGALCRRCCHVMAAEDVASEDEAAWGAEGKRRATAVNEATG